MYVKYIKKCCIFVLLSNRMKSRSVSFVHPLVKSRSFFCFFIFLPMVKSRCYYKECELLDLKKE